MSSVRRKEEEIYETPDHLPEDDQHLRESATAGGDSGRGQRGGTDEEHFDSDSIIRTYVDVKEAFQQFRGKLLNADDVDFSDSLIKRRRRGYGGGAYVLEIVGNATDEPETLEQKYHRLTYEINELGEQLQLIANDTKKKGLTSTTAAIPSIDDVVGLQHQIKNLQIEQILGAKMRTTSAISSDTLSMKLTENIEKLKTATVRQPSPAAKGAGDGQQLSRNDADSAERLVVLEARLKRIETAIGGDELSAIGGTTSIVETVDQLQSRVALLDSTQLDGLDARLTALLQKLSQVAEKKKEKLSDDSEKRIAELFELMTKYESVCASLPAIVDRLRSLQKLHDQAMQFSQALTQLDGVQQQLLKSVETDSKLIQELRQSLAENMQLLKTSCDNIEKRLTKIRK